MICNGEKHGVLKCDFAARGRRVFLYGIKLIRSGPFEENYERFRAKYNID